MDEYAYGFTNENTHYGPVRNPFDPERTPGGSSGGSGAAVGAACVPLALGTDTNGSVRVPASLCGVFGLKPTFGRISRAGVTPFAPSLDHVGCLTRSARDAALAFEIMHGFDPADPVSGPRARESVVSSIDRGIAGLRVARAVGYFEEEATADALEAARAVAAALGAACGEIVPEAEIARQAAMIVTAVEGSALHLHDLRTRPADFDPMTRDRFIAGALVPGEAYVRAQTFRHAYREAVRRLFGRVDILVAAATPMVAPRIGQSQIDIGGSSLPSRAHLGRFTQPISFVGLPVVVVPTRTSCGLPIGVQLIGAPYSEGVLLRAAHFLETDSCVPGAASARVTRIVGGETWTAGPPPDLRERPAIWISTASGCGPFWPGSAKTSSRFAPSVSTSPTSRRPWKATGRRSGFAMPVPKVPSSSATLPGADRAWREAFGVAAQDLLPELLRRMRSSPEIVEVLRGSAPVQEVVATGDDVDLTALPVHLQHGMDGGLYISASIDFVVDPRTRQTNVGVRRLMLYGPRETGIDLVAPSDLQAIYRAAVARQENLPVSFVVGAHPIDLVAATMRLPGDELALVASLRDAPLPVVKCLTNDIRRSGRRRMGPGGLSRCARLRGG